MKNKRVPAISAFFLVLLAGTFLTKSALAHGETSTTSASRAAIERTEEKVLGSEKHAELEKLEPSIDDTVKRIAPIAFGGASIIVLLFALYLKAKKKNMQ